jgi:hypothetical protein
VPAYLVEALTDDLRLPRYQGNPDPLAGHCYVVAEAIYHRGKSLGHRMESWFIRHEGEPHWFVSEEYLGVLDPTSPQFKRDVPYERAVRKGFLTKQPSKRARLLMERMGWEVPA